MVLRAGYEWGSQEGNTMLVLGRHVGESITLEIDGVEPIKITVLENGRIGIEAEEGVSIIRTELLDD